MLWHVEVQNSSEPCPIETPCGPKEDPCSASTRKWSFNPKNPLRPSVGIHFSEECLKAAFSPDQELAGKSSLFWGGTLGLLKQCIQRCPNL